MTRPIAAAIVLLYVAFAAIRLNEYYKNGRSDWRSIMSYVHDRARPGDQIVLANGWVTRNVAFYWMTVPAPPGVSIFMFIERPEDLVGPAWIVTGQCRPREPLLQVTN